MIDNLTLGLSTALSVSNLLWCFAGAVLGTIVGVIPAIGPMAALSILLPLTWHTGDATGALIMLAGIYYGCQYGGSTSAILLKIPGEISSIVTAIDGHELAKQGMAGKTLAVAALSSFAAGIITTAVILVLAVPAAELFLQFGPTEMTALMVFGIIVSIALTQGSFVSGLIMIIFGGLVGMIGTDINSGVARFTGDIALLSDGISFAVLAVGVFGLGELAFNLLHPENYRQNKVALSGAWLSWHDIKQCIPACLRGTLVGSLCGLLPGPGSMVGSTASYVLEKKLKRDPPFVGTGAIEAVAGPEAANNAASQISFIPVLIMGLPLTPVMTLMIGALIMHDIQPGPFVITQRPDLFWGLIISMFCGNLMLLCLNLPLIKLWIVFLRLPPMLLSVSVLMACLVGVYSINNNPDDLIILCVFALLGYLFKVWKYEPAPFAMGYVIVVAMEEYLRRSLAISQGDWSTFLHSPTAAVLLSISILMIMFRTTSMRLTKKSL